MTKTVEVSNVRCEGCANTIKKALKEEGFNNIVVDLSCEPRTVTADIMDEASLAQLRTTLRKLGYPFYDEEINFGESTKLKAKSFVSCAVGKFNTKDDTN
jgi:copper chaperone